jgi:hypothetical protein
MPPQIPKPWETAMAAQNEIYGYVSTSQGIRYMAGWLSERLSNYGVGAMNPSEVALRCVIPDLVKCEPIYVTSEMQQLVYMAMETFDRTEMMHEDDFFLRSGFAYLDEPFMSLDAHGKRLAWRAVSWVFDDMWTADSNTYYNPEKQDEFAKRVMTGGKQAFVDNPDFTFEPVVRITLWSHMLDVDDYPYPPEVLEEARSRGQFWGVAHATAIPIKEISNMAVIVNEGDTLAAWLTFLRVMNRLMGEKIVVRSPQKPHRALRRESQRLKLDKSDVIVVELRKRQDAPSGVPGSGREYSHQWIVHGFWRKQPYGPGLKFRRQKYISDYVKGPKDKPLIVKNRVWLWDR